jgi:hypothetical protein
MSKLLSVVIRRGLPALGMGILWGVGERMGVALFDSVKEKKAVEEGREREPKQSADAQTALPTTEA